MMARVDNLPGKSRLELKPNSQTTNIAKTRVIGQDEREKTYCNGAPSNISLRTFSKHLWGGTLFTFGRPQRWANMQKKKKINK